jgi:hypothetical protein
MDLTSVIAETSWRLLERPIAGWKNSAVIVAQPALNKALPIASLSSAVSVRTARPAAMLDAR